MEDKIVFTFEDTNETVEFYVIEQTRLGGVNYLLVTESDEDEADAYIMKDLSGEDDIDAIYEMVEDDNELEVVSKIFAQMLDDCDIEL